jgi:hypothetical protein
MQNKENMQNMQNIPKREENMQEYAEKYTEYIRKYGGKTEYACGMPLIMSFSAYSAYCKCRICRI